MDGRLKAAVTGPRGRRSAIDSPQIGKMRWGLNYLNGQMDEVTVHNYPLSDLEIAQRYNALTGIPFCLPAQRPSLDLNNDCKVDLGDFTLLAGQCWIAR